MPTASRFALAVCTLTLALAALSLQPAVAEPRIVMVQNNPPPVTIVLPEFIVDHPADAEIARKRWSSGAWSARVTDA